MNLTFQPMGVDFAASIATWRYPAPYTRYGFGDATVAETVAYLTRPEHQVFAVVEDGQLVAFRSFGPDGQVAGGDYSDDYLDTGGGLRPDLTGRGLGSKILLRGLEFGNLHFGKSRFRVTVADFNVRAQKVCERVGFEPVQRFRRINDGLPFTVFTMDLAKRSA